MSEQCAGGRGSHSPSNFRFLRTCLRVANLHYSIKQGLSLNKVNSWVCHVLDDHCSLQIHTWIEASALFSDDSAFRFRCGLMAGEGAGDPSRYVERSRDG